MKRRIGSYYALIWLGVWLLATHMALGYSQKVLSWSDGISGGLLMILGGLCLSGRYLWAPWVACFIGIWLQFAPLLFWAQNPAAYLNDTVIGALVILTSVIFPGMPGRGEEPRSSIPEGWSYNPSSWPQRLPIILLGTIGWLISRYLAADQLGYIHRAWDPVFGAGTWKVITSRVSHDFPVPDAGLGAMAYTLEVLLALKGGESRWRSMPWMVILFGLVVIPLGLTSITLIILQPLVVGAWCTLCLVTAFCMVVMIAFAVDEVAAVLQFLRKRAKTEPFWDLFWRGDISDDFMQDTRTPSLDQSPWDIVSAACWGVTASWTLLLSVGVGFLLMLLPWLDQLSHGAADRDHVLGAFVIVISIVSMAEILRKVRYLNIILGLFLLGSLGWIADGWVVHAILAVVLVILSFRKGSLRERFHRGL